MNVRVRGIYATALTRLLGSGEAVTLDAGSDATGSDGAGETDDATVAVVQASSAIRDRFDAAFPTAAYDVAVETGGDRQGVAVTGPSDAVATLADRLAGVGIDTLRWSADAPRGAVFDGLVTETPSSGAVVDLGPTEGFLPFSATESYVETGDAVRVQVREPAPAWSDDRATLDTDIEVGNGVVRLVRDGDSQRRSDGSSDSSGPRGGSGPGAAADRLDLLSTDPPAGWRVRWEPAADDAAFATLDDALAEAGDRAVAIDDTLAAADGSADDPAADTAPRPIGDDRATAWVWFGRASRFGLDDRRRAVVPTMPGHHRIKAGDERAGTAVDFAEAVCAFGTDDDASGDDATVTDDAEFPFGAVADQFGPHEGDTVAIQHGKPDGRSFALGRGTVTERDDDGMTLRREMHSQGTYDALGTDRRPGDVATTRFVEGRWWYATVYRDADGASRGTYVNVCTPLELFPSAVRYVDLHVDVVRRPDGTVERVDDDELDAAVADGHVPEALAERARAVAERVAENL